MVQLFRVVQLLLLHYHAVSGDSLDHALNHSHSISTHVSLPTSVPISRTSSVVSSTQTPSVPISGTRTSSVPISGAPSSVPISSTYTSSVSISSSQASSVSISSSQLPSSTLNASTTTSASATSTPTISSGDAADIATITERRISDIISAEDATGVASLLASQSADGTWPNVNYAAGCPAQRANWPAQNHWLNILTLSSAWHGGVKGDTNGQFTKDPTVRAAITLALEWWFANDFTVPGCIDSGGTPACPCGTPGLWNTNWFDAIILIPGLVGEVCLILGDTLTAAQVGNCTHMTGRAYDKFDQQINGLGTLTGANALDVSSFGVDQALLTSNISLLTDAYRRVHKEVAVVNTIRGDGIRADGSFGQHAGILYNGNYGKDYLNDVLSLEINAGGTQFAAPAASQSAFATLIDGNRWMIYKNIVTGVYHWDFSVLGRFISFAIIDSQQTPQATGGINFNVTQLEVLGKLWNSPVLTDAAAELSRNSHTANAGDVVGNNMFYANDYMVHRGANYVTTVKMFSSRTQNTECTNLANPFGFHLSDGAVHTYIAGNEYEDIAASWDWNLIPGITVDYGATVLDCAHTQVAGVEAFVGGVSTGSVGIAAMRYTNPLTGSLKFQKAWFFLENDVQQVMVSGVKSATTAPVYSVLDQRLHSGEVRFDNTSLWHGSVGYVFPRNISLSVKVGPKTGNWSAIGTSLSPPTTVDLFSAFLKHENITAPISYTAFPGVDFKSFETKSKTLQVQILQNTDTVSAIFDSAHNTFYGVFWGAQGGSSDVPCASSKKHSSQTMRITVNGNAAVIFGVNSGNITISDPSQTLANLTVTLSKTTNLVSSNKTFSFTLPSGGFAGQSVSQIVKF